MITVLLNDNGERVTLNADPKDVSIESSALVIRRDKVIIARFRRHLCWHETTDDTDTHD